MPIKQDLNRSGWESTDFPSVCETCLPDNPYIKMLKEDHGAECKLCTRPFTVFSWNSDRPKRTIICLTCARLKNCCQGCMLDLSFGLPIAVRDAALKMVAPGPQSDVNREYFAQNNEKLIEGKAALDEYDRTDDKARELLRLLAESKPYFRRGRADAGGGAGRASAVGAAAVPGPVRTRDKGRAFRALPAAQLPPSQRDWLPPDDANVMSLFVTGIEDDLPEFKLRDFFRVHGKIKSLVCSHMSHCAFVNYETREAAEAAAAACRGRAVVAGCPLRVRWGRPRAIGTMKKEESGQMLRDSRLPRGGERGQASAEGGAGRAAEDAAFVAPPPGAETPNYASLGGD